MKINDLLGCAGVAFLLLFVFSLVPLIGAFFSLLVPLPFLYYSSKLGQRDGLKIGVAAILLTGLGGILAGFPQLFFLALELGFLGLIISECYRREYPFGLTVVIGTVAVLLFGILILVAVGVTQDMGPLELVKSYFQANVKETMTVYRGSGWDQEKLRQFQDYARVVGEIIGRIYPSLMIIGAGFLVWINVVVSKPIFRLRNLKYPDFAPLDRWRAPEHLVWGVIASGFALFFPSTSVKFISLNLLLVLLVVYVFQGLSILLFFLNKYRVPPWIRIGIYLLIVLQQVFLIGLALAGLFDQWVDFRKIHARKES